MEQVPLDANKIHGGYMDPNARMQLPQTQPIVLNEVVTAMIDTKHFGSDGSPFPMLAPVSTALRGLAAEIKQTNFPSVHAMATSRAIIIIFTNGIVISIGTVDISESMLALERILATLRYFGMHGLVVHTPESNMLEKASAKRPNVAVAAGEGSQYEPIDLQYQSYLFRSGKMGAAPPIASDNPFASEVSVNEFCTRNNLVVALNTGFALDLARFLEIYQEKTRNIDGAMVKATRRGNARKLAPDQRIDVEGDARANKSMPPVIVTLPGVPNTPYKCDQVTYLIFSNGYIIITRGKSHAHIEHASSYVQKLIEPFVLPVRNSLADPKRKIDPAMQHVYPNRRPMLAKSL